MFDTQLLADVIANYVYIVTNRLMLLSVEICFLADVIANVLLVLTNSNNNRADVIAMLLFFTIID